METLNQIQSFVPHLLVMCLPLIEVAVRACPTLNKLSFFYVVGDVLHGLGDFSHSIGDSLNSVIPQRLKDQAAPAPAPAPAAEAAHA